MPSPFPGMNPYLEQADTWEELRAKGYLKDDGGGFYQLVPGK